MPLFYSIFSEMGSNEKGEKTVEVVFDDPARQRLGETMTLDTERLARLKEEYIKRYRIRQERED